VEVDEALERQLRLAAHVRVVAATGRGGVPRVEEHAQGARVEVAKDGIGGFGLDSAVSVHGHGLRAAGVVQPHPHMDCAVLLDGLAHAFVDVAGVGLVHFQRREREIAGELGVEPVEQPIFGVARTLGVDEREAAVRLDQREAGHREGQRVAADQKEEVVDLALFRVGGDFRDLHEGLSLVGEGGLNEERPAPHGSGPGP